MLEISRFRIEHSRFIIFFEIRTEVTFNILLELQCEIAAILVRRAKSTVFQKRVSTLLTAKHICSDNEIDKGVPRFVLHM